MIDRVKKLLFPPRCIFCRELLSAQEQYICIGCSTKHYELSRPKAHKGAFYNEALAVYRYDGEVRRALHRFKFHGGVHMAEFFGTKMAERVISANWQFDIIVSIPSHISKVHKKGYDHAFLLAEVVAQKTGVPFARLLRKTRRTKSMYGLQPAQRRANIMDSIALKAGSDVKDKRILLVDDIITTGSTASECARVLKQAGAKSVAVITAAGIK